MPEMKQCHACGEEIKPIAKRCPHCQTWQSKWRIEPSDPKWVISWIVLLFGVWGGIIFFSFPKEKDKNVPDYASSLVVTESKLHYMSCENGSFIAVLGKIENESEIPWKNLYFEVQFFDSGNNLIDTISDNIYGLIVLPRSEAAFKVSDRANKNEEEYASHKIIINRFIR